MLDHLLTDGYLVVPDLLSAVELDRLRHETDRHLADIHSGNARPIVREEGGTPFRAENIAAFPIGDRSVLAARMNPTALDAVSDLLGADVISFGSVMVFKLPSIGPAVGMHRDIAENVFSDDHLWIAAGLYLDDSAVDNGCLWAVPGSHRLVGAELAAESARGLDSPAAVPIPVGAGSLLLHDSRLLHGSMRAVAGGLRRVLYHSYQSADWMLREGLKRSFKPDAGWIAESFALMEWGLELRGEFGYPDPEVRWTVPAGWADRAHHVRRADDLAVIRYRLTDVT
jgi:ectoine hydroxylase-related dioxygenase (phytanoyl-CoA dioxygenase family)